MDDRSHRSAEGYADKLTANRQLGIFEARKEAANAYLAMAV